MDSCCTIATISDKGTKRTIDHIARLRKSAYSPARVCFLGLVACAVGLRRHLQARLSPARASNAPSGSRARCVRIGGSQQQCRERGGAWRREDFPLHFHAPKPLDGPGLSSASCRCALSAFLATRCLCARGSWVSGAQATYPQSTDGTRASHFCHRRQAMSDGRAVCDLH